MSAWKYKVESIYYDFRKYQNHHLYYGYKFSYLICALENSPEHKYKEIFYFQIHILQEPGKKSDLGAENY